MKFSDRSKKKIDQGGNKYKCYRQAKHNLITQTTKDNNRNVLTQFAFSSFELTYNFCDVKMFAFCFLLFWQYDMLFMKHMTFQNTVNTKPVV